MIFIYILQVDIHPGMLTLGSLIPMSECNFLNYLLSTTKDPLACKNALQK